MDQTTLAAVDFLHQDLLTPQMMHKDHVDRAISQTVKTVKTSETDFKHESHPIK